jgi:Tol biopolymer transport system component/tRNA A-37 threonylcarbamoyl transferase component Bud32
MSMADEAHAWSRAKQVLQEALEQTPEARAAFVAQACRGDDSLLADVESLLAAHEAAGSFGERPAVEALRIEDPNDRDGAASLDRALRVGERLGPYQIDSWIGAGGMGEVYKATDTRLHRPVALKVLFSGLWPHPDLEQRLTREARAVAALRHPHICLLHDVGEATLDTGQRVSYLVMEHLEGETLAERLKRGPLPIDQVLRFGVQIAEALVETHRHGIVHRDLKPGNIMLTAEGVKLLDFGVAKQQAAVATSGAITDSTSTMTASRWMVGTLHYMTPEQLEGKPVDARTDVFAFGAVLYEMATGKKAFTGDSDASVVAAILDREPEGLSGPAGGVIPRDLAPVIHRCVRKRPDERWQTAGDVLDELRRVAADFADGRMRVLTPVRWARLAWVAALVVGVLGVTVAVTKLGGVSLPWRSASAKEAAATTSAALPPIVVGNVHQLTPGEELEIDPAISPDGKFVAYSAGNANHMRVYVRAIAGGRALRLTDAAEALEYQPRWSPDGANILYVTGQEAYIAPAFGGAPRRVDSSDSRTPYAGEAPVSRISDAFWSPDGRHIAVAHGGTLVMSELDGRESPRLLARSPADLHHCSWSADARWIACTSGNWRFAGVGGLFGTVAASKIVVISTERDEVDDVTSLASQNQGPQWDPDSHHLYFVSNRDGTYDIYSVDMSPRGKPLGAPARVTTGLGVYSIALAGDGKRLAYTVYSSRANIFALPIPSKGPVDVSRARAITTGNQTIESMMVSRDGKWLVYDSTLYGNGDIFRIPIEGGPVERLTTHPAGDFAPDLSPDGRVLAYHSWRTEKSRDVFVQPVDGGPLEQLTFTLAQESYPHWFPDGRAILFYNLGGSPRFNLIRRNESGQWGSPTAVDFLEDIEGLTWMPDGRSLVFVKDGNVGIVSWETRMRQVVYRQTSSGDPHAESIRPDPNGRTVYFKSHDKQGFTSFWSVPTKGGRPTLLVTFTDPDRQSSRFDFAVDAHHFYFTIEERRSNIWVADVTERER